MFSVSSPATDRKLLTTEESRAAIGAAAACKSNDEIDELCLQISDLIALECCVPIDGVNPGTFRLETIEETIPLEQDFKRLTLARRFIASIDSIVVDGTELGESDFRLSGGSGIVERLSASGPSKWSKGTVVVTYDAGFDTVPPALKLAAKTILREQWSAASRDPMLKSEVVEDIGRVDYWVNSSGAGYGAISSAARAMLSQFSYCAVIA